jgi:hypothetical protein
MLGMVLKKPSKYLEKKGFIEKLRKEEIESDPELKRSIVRAKKDISDGNVYTTEEIFDAIERGEI